MSLPMLAASPTPGTIIENQSTGSFIDEQDNLPKTVVSDKVIVTVGEVAGITVTTNGVTGTPNPGTTIYYSFVITNVGNDPTQFFIPSLGNLTGNATQPSNIEITGYNLNGTTPVAIATPVVVPTGGGQTGSNGTATGLLGANGGGIIQPGGSVTVRVPVKVNSNAAKNDIITVQLGDTPVDPASTATPQARLENQAFIVGNNDVYTVDNPDSLETSAGLPINGDATNHRQEAAALQSTLVIAGNSLSCNNIYGITSDATNTLLKTFDPTNGTTATVATMGAAANAFTLGIDPIGGKAYYVANAAGATQYHIFAYDPISGVTTDTGTVVPIPSGLSALQLGFDKTGLGYIVDQNFNAWSFTPTSSVVTSLGVVGGLSGYNGGDIAFDSNNDYWMVSRNTSAANGTVGNYTLFRVTRSGNTLTANKVGDLQEGGVTVNNAANIGSIAFDPAGNLYIVRSSDGHSWKIDPKTAIATTIAASIANNGNGISDFATCAIPTIVINPTTISISGKVWNDKDASGTATFTNINTNGEVGTNAVFGTTTVPVNAILVDATTNKVLATQVVGADGTYSFAGVSANTNVKIILSPTAGTVAAAPPTAVAPTGWVGTSPIDSGIFNTGAAAITSKDFGIRQKAKLVLLKRITKINGQTTNPNDGTVLNSPTTDTLNVGVNNWPTNYLFGTTSAGKIKPGDAIEYTIYFLNNQGADANTVKLCDPIRGAQVYVANSLQLQLGSGTITAQTDAPDLTDRGHSYLTGNAPANCNAAATTSIGADNGGVAIGIPGVDATLPPIPGAIGLGNPPESYGLFRFVTQVKP